MRLGENKQASQKSNKSPRRKSQAKSETTEYPDKHEGDEAKKNVEKRVSFDSNVPNNVDEDSKASGKNDEEAVVPEVHFAKEETTPVELCDIEPLSGTVFRKVTVRRRRQDMRKIQAVDTGESLPQIYSGMFPLVRVLCLNTKSFPGIKVSGTITTLLYLTVMGCLRDN